MEFLGKIFRGIKWVLGNLLWALSRVTLVAYLLVFRSFLYVFTLALLLYFSVNTSYFLDTLHPILADVLPGSITLERLQFGPSPGQIRLVGVTINDPNDEEVITADSVYATVDILKLGVWGSKNLAIGLGLSPVGERMTPFQLDVTSADVRDFWVHLDFKAGEHLTLVNAFVSRDEEEEEKEPGAESPKVVIRNAVGTNGKVKMEFKHFEMRMKEVSFSEGDVIVHHGRADVFVESLDVLSGWLRLDESISPVAGEPVDMDVSALELKDFAMEGDEFILSAFDGKVGEGSVSLEGHLSWWEDEGVRFWTDAEIKVPQSEDIVERILGGTIDGAIDASISGGGDFFQPTLQVEVDSPELNITGVVFRDLQAAGAVRVRKEKGMEVQIGALESRFGGGRIAIRDGYLNTQNTSFNGSVFLEGLQGVGTLKDLGMELDSPLLPLSLGGDFKVEGEVSSARKEVTVQTDAQPLSLRFDPEKFGAFDSFSVEGGLGVAWAGENWTLSAKDCVTRSRGAQLFGNGHWSSKTGWEGEMELNSLDLDTLSDFIGLPLGGKLSLSKTAVVGEIPDVSESRLRVSDAMVDGIELGDLSGILSLTEGTILLEDALLSPGGGVAKGRVKVQLLHDSDEGETSDYPFHVQRLQVSDMELASLVPAMAGTTLDVRKGSLRGVLNDPLRSLRGEVVGQVEGLDGATMGLVREGGGSLLFDREGVELREGYSMLSSGEYIELQQFRWNWLKRKLTGEVAIPAIELASHPVLADMGLAGNIQGNLSFELGPKRSFVEGALTAENVTGFGLVVGSGEMTLRKTGPGVMAIESSDFFHGGNVLEESELKLGAYGIPRKIVLTSLFRDLNGVTLFPAFRDADVDVKFDGRATVAYDNINRGSSPLLFRIEVDKGGLRGTLNGGSVPVTTTIPATLSYAGDGRWEVDDLTLLSDERELEVCGVLNTKGKNDLYVRAITPLDLFGLEKEWLSVLEGNVVTSANERVSRRYSKPCFSPESGLGNRASGFLHVGGTLQAPVVEGSLALSGLRVRPRGNTIDLRLDEGVLSLESMKRAGSTTQRIVFPEPIEGRVGGGQFRLTGDALFTNWRFRAADMALELVDVSYAPTPELKVRVNAEVALQGETLLGTTQPLTLRGNVNLLEGGYVPKASSVEELTARFDGGEESSSGSTESMRLGDTLLDLDVQGANFGVRAVLPVGETDMELRLDTKVKGTLSEPQILGRVEAISGGTIRNGVINREFEVVKATADFSGDPLSPTITAEVQTEVTYQEAATSDPFGGADQIMSTFNSSGPEDKSVVIRAVLDGKADFGAPGRELEDFELSLSSDSGSYGQAELVPLLVSGVPPGSKGGVAGESGATVPLIANDVENLLTSSLLGAFVDRVQLGVNLEGGVDWGLRKLVGDNLTLEVRGQQYTEGQSVRPQFDLRLTDRLSLQGAMKYYQFGAEDGEQVYETKIRYRIPLN